ncbi:G-type lectin S-receptor-like serine/threonine-protein kinase [Melia azedarach]|uniref:G-type lectin S-receptor-like serine/threonine-protein kinase n=1 Tax=Melia azedarach TaxID=155640 RepID=A0ACC1YKY9_MELAZ|nr:G-type lectin S-receptor-like serine/threonine-protein kinase [Melia azedarach]
MCEISLTQLNSELPIKHFPGKSGKICCFKKFRSFLVVFLLLGFAFCGMCDELPMVSVPLGFEISGFDRSKTWVSQNGVFAFGFLESSSKDSVSDGFVVGVRYNLGDKVANLPIWTVGGGLRVSENSTIRLNFDGRLILFENPSKLIVWSSNTSSLGVQKATLLNSGNLVLMGTEDNVLWESFNSPTNTLLPGQNFHFPQVLRASSTKATSSFYNFVIRRSGELDLVWESNVTYWRTHLSSNGGVIKEARFDSSGVLGLFDDSNKTIWSISSKDLGDPSVVLRHLRVDSDGNLRIYSWDNVVPAWKVGWQAVQNQCDVFGFCGLYSVCGYNSTGPICDCLYDTPVYWENDLPAVDTVSSGCRKMVDLGNCKMNTSMMVLKQTVLYGLYPPLDVNLMLNEEACKEYCSNDSTCIAVTSKNDGSGLCTVKRTSFISGYRNPSTSAKSFLKVCLVPQAVSARGANPHNNAKPIPILSEGVSEHGGDSKTFMGAIALIIFGTISGFLSIEVFVFWFIYWRRKIKAQTRIPFGKDAQMNPHYSILIRLSYEEIRDLTANFRNQLGPSVYKGLLPNKMPVIAKVLNVVATEKDYRMAVSTLGRMHHRNLVSIKGFCFEPGHTILLYEYVPNGSLDNWLFNVEQAQNEGNRQQRLDIALGIARALAYLHLECQACVAHGNLKLENVMLDEKLVPKVTDFGFQSLLGNEVASSSESLPERDIYMFGEMLLQIVTCKRDIVGINFCNLLNKMNEELNLESSKESERVERAVRIALWCMQNRPFLRPSIGEVVKVLEGTLSVDRPPSNFPLRDDQVNENLSWDFKVDS